MRLAIRLLMVPALLGVLATGVVAFGPAPQADAASPRVVMLDNDGPLPRDGLDARTGEWGFGPSHIMVMKGESVTFVNPTGGNRPHNVVSISRAGTAAEPVLESGTKFSSGLTTDTLVRPGNTWVLDTSTVDPGYYAYYCSLHPWMVGSITVLAPPAPAPAPAP